MSDWLALLGIVFAGLATAFGLFKMGKSTGAQQERLDAENDDLKSAADLRRRVDRERADRVRQLDDAGYRDSE